MQTAEEVARAFLVLVVSWLARWAAGHDGGGDGQSDDI